MTILDITLSLPDEMAQEATEQGLLTPEAIQHLIRAELGRRKHQRLREIMDKLAALDVPPLTNDELNEEIRAARAERRASRARRS